jgi:hypothetical protein
LGIDYYLSYSEAKKQPEIIADESFAEPVFVFENGGKQITMGEILNHRPTVLSVSTPITTNNKDCGLLPLNVFLDKSQPAYNRMLQLNTAIACHAKSFNVDPLLFTAMIGIESAYNWRAVSNKGAMGLTQVMPKTALQFCTSERIRAELRAIKSGDDIDRNDFLNSPHKQLYCGAMYLEKRLKQSKGQGFKVYSFVNSAIVPNEYAIAVCAYNAGWGRIEQYGGCPPFRETTNHLMSFQKRIEFFREMGAKMPAARELGLG